MISKQINLSRRKWPYVKGFSQKKHLANKPTYARVMISKQDISSNLAYLLTGGIWQDSSKFWGPHRFNTVQGISCKWPVQSERGLID